jgi:hypothetical protein
MAGAEGGEGAAEGGQAPRKRPRASQQPLGDAAAAQQQAEFDAAVARHVQVLA